MTREPFIAYSELTNEIYIVVGKEKYRVTEQAIKAVMAIKALEQEDIFDKIRAEIEQLTSRYTISRERGGMGQVEWSDMLIKESEVLQIIDKYKAESEPKDGGNELTELTNPFGDSRFGG